MPSASPVIERPLEDASQRAKLEAICNSTACEHRRAVALDFIAIQNKVGPRWSTKREDIWAQIERTILRHAGRDTLFCRLNQTEYLLAFPDKSGGAAQAVAFQIIEDVLVHFLGRISSEDLVVRYVASIKGDQVIASLIIDRPEPDPDGRALDAGPAEMGEPSSISTPSIIEDINGEISISLTLEEVINLKTDAVVGGRLSGLVYDRANHRILSLKDRALLSTRTLLAIDLHVLAAMRRVMAERDDLAAVITPMAIQPFGNSNSRVATFERLNRLGPVQRSRLIIELTGLEGGTPPSRILEAQSLVKPFCKSVVCRALPSRSCVSSLAAARVNAISISTQEIGGEGGRTAAGLLAFGEAVRNLAPVRMATSLFATPLLEVCSLAGYTHATLPAGRFRSQAAPQLETGDLAA